MLTFCGNATETGTELVIQSRVQLRVDSQYSSSNKCSRCGSFAPSYSSVDLGGADTVRRLEWTTDFTESCFLQLKET